MTHRIPMDIAEKRVGDVLVEFESGQVAGFIRPAGMEIARRELPYILRLIEQCKIEN